MTIGSIAIPGELPLSPNSIQSIRLEELFSAEKNDACNN